MRYDDYDDEIDRIRARSNRRRVYKATGRTRHFTNVPDVRVDDEDDGLELIQFNQEIDDDTEQFLDEEDLNSDEEFDDIEPVYKEKKAKTKKTSKKPKKKKRKLLIFLFIACLLVAAFYIYSMKKDSGIWTIAVFGVDSRDGNLEKGALSDVEMLAVVDRATGEITLVSVFRDTYLQISSDGTYHKINEAYFKGGHKQAVSALETNLDLKIDDYATFNWKAVADTINILGGIDIEITDQEFAYINSFITETAESTNTYSTHLEHSGMNHLDGVQSVAYARLRLMDTDFNRTQRQRTVLSLTMEKAKQADKKTLLQIATYIIPQLSTSIGVDDLIPMMNQISKYHIGNTSGFPFSHSEVKIGKKDCVVATTLESNVVQLHAFLYGETAYTASAAVKKISSQIISDSGLGEVGNDVETDRQKPSGDSSGSISQTQQTNVPVETESIPETSTEGSTEETTVEETVEEVTAEETTTATEESSGPGSQVQPTKPGDGEKPEPTKETTENMQHAPVEPSPTKVEETTLEAPAAELPNAPGEQPS